MSPLLLAPAVWMLLTTGGSQELEVREVTQPMLALSPDGEVLYFGVLGDLVALPVDGGEAAVLTQGPAHDRAPLPSADGRQLDFLSDRTGEERLFRLNLATKEVAPIDGDPGLHGRTLRLLADGARTGVDVRDRQRPLFRRDASGYSEHYRPAPSERVEWAGLGPHGRFAVLAESGPWNDLRPEGVRVRVVDLEADRVVVELESEVYPGERDRCPRAAVGREAAYVPRDGDIVRVDLASGAAQALEWSVRLPFEPPPPVPPRDARATAASAAAPVRGIDRVHAAPDGAAVVFASLGDIWLQPLDGQARALTTGVALDRFPQWGPEGTWVYFARDGELARVPAAGGDVTVVGPRVAVEFFDLFELSPDGTRVAHPVSLIAPGVQTAAVGDADWEVHLEGRPTRGAWVTFPSFGADDELLFTQSFARGELPQVHVLDDPAATPRALTELERPPVRAVASRDGRWLAILRDGRAWLAERAERRLDEEAFRALGPVGAHSLSFARDSQRLWVAAGSEVFAFACEDGRETLRLRLQLPARAARVPAPLVLDGCHVVDVEKGVLLRDRRVLIEGGRIRAIEPREGPLDPLDQGVRVVAAQGQYLIPGLFDMHVHQVAPLARSLLAWGVTTVRQLGSVWPAQLTEPELFVRGERLGPRHLSAGEIFEGVPPAWGNAFHLVESADEARALVARRARDGVFEVKLYPTLERGLRRVVAAEARRQGLRVTSHVGSFKDAVTALRDGSTCLEHWPEELPDLHGDLIALLKACGAAWCPTLSVRGAGELVRRLRPEELDEPRLRATVPPPVLRRWSAQDKVGAMSDRNLERLLHTRASAVARAHAAGVPILVGSDASLGNALVGPSTHWELEQLVRGGLEPLEALRAATRVPARYAGRADLGVVRAGAVADLVLLTENPLEDIRATRTVAGIVLGGRWLPRAELVD